MEYRGNMSSRLSSNYDASDSKIVEYLVIDTDSSMWIINKIIYNYVTIIFACYIVENVFYMKTFEEE